ncbi:hypothetical protein A1O1_06051 [Capronia coronata CBS 617.96]|uniref:DUF3533 domain-containing protein n=1 Tax=Capronia coronata CBS 617.96 TaxID=1182541 RepID=W9Y7S0_9EURO|nr:uncharacterized protein A1O1_06051 [Capronia coronata CBS 617.96]EXJ85685.1 hypothetical protein A1O1_06051 [Capronia coronata CBS 617.96]
MAPKIHRHELKLSHGPAWGGQRKTFLTSVAFSFVLLQLLFLANMSLLYGSQYRDAYRTHHMKVLAVDYDGGVVGESLLGAYRQLKGDTFPTLDIRPASEYPDYGTIKEAVCQGHFWAAVYSLSGASERLSAALQGGTAATSYNSSNAIRYVYNEARYPTTEAGYVTADLQQLIAASRTVYNQLNGTSAYGLVNQSDSAAIEAFLDPFTASSIDLKPTEQGTRVLYNTASVALSIVQQFFFIMAINGISNGLSLFSRLTVQTNGLIRLGFAATYTFIGSLCWTGYIWAYKEDWALTGGQFMLIWMLGWLFMHINFLILDTASVLIPMQFMPFFVLTWVILNITISLANFDQSPSFYKYGYALPAHNWYETFVTITSDGCYNRLYRNLPVLFAWFILGHLLVVPATVHRCRAANKQVEEEEKNKLERQRTHNSHREEKGADADGEGSNRHSADAESAETASTSDSDTLSARRTRSNSVAYGPSMPLAFAALSRRLTQNE